MAHALDLGIGDVHTPGAVAAPAKKSTMAQLPTSSRKSLPSSAFADPAERKYPIPDKAHADNAAARLEQQKSSMSPGKYARLKARIQAAQKRFGEKPKSTKAASSTRSAFRGHSRGLRMSMTHPDGTRTEIRHMAAYSDADDRLILSIPLDKSAALADGDENKRVWVQVGRAGRWLGHRQGPFELNSQIFDAIIRNFRSQNVGRIQYDFEHVSEMRPTEGSIPMVGVPAQGWIYDLRHDGRNLYALTEWKELAREYIKNDQYQGVSPAISWKNKDRVTASDIGPMLTSVALTNKPFLAGMQPPHAASTQGVTWLTAEGEEAAAGDFSLLASSLCYSANEYMPRIKGALRMPELASAQQCSDQLGLLRGHFDAAGGDPNATRHGINLCDYMMSMRNVVQPPMGATWDDVFDLMQDLIDAAMDEHVIEYHEGDDDDDDDEAAASAATAAAEQLPAGAPALAASTNLPTEEPNPMTVPAVQPATASPVTPAATQLTTSPDVQTLTATVQAKDAEITALSAEVQSLSAWKAERETKDINARVDAAFATYKDKKGLTDEMRPTLATLCRSDSDGFDRMYPPVGIENAHLLRNLTKERVAADTATTVEGAVAATAASAELPVMTLSNLADHIAKTESLPFTQAMLKAERLMNRARKQTPATAPAAR